MKITVLTLFISFALQAFASEKSEKCSSRVKIAALGWAEEVFESDLEADRQIGASPISIEIKQPVLLDKSKRPDQVAEAYSVAWLLKFKDKKWDYNGTFFYDENCHRMKDAEIKAIRNKEKPVTKK